MPTLRLIGPGRAGLALTGALETAGWELVPPLGRGDDLRGAAAGVDVLVIATPDGVVAGVAAAVQPVATTTVAHLAGSLTLDVLHPHPRRASVHPLVALADPTIGARRLRGAWFGVAASDPASNDVAMSMVEAMGGTAIEVADTDRPLYHAAACIASNHLVALLGQVERVAAAAGVPLAAYLDLVRGTVDNVAALGPASALTGPVARGDWVTVAAHRRRLPAEELPAYDALAAEAARLAGRAIPDQPDLPAPPDAPGREPSER